MTETESKWAERIREWKASGQSAADYAQGRGFEASTLRWWASRIGRGAVTGTSATAKPKAAPRVRLVRVVPAAKPATRSLTIRVGAAYVEVGAGFDRALLRELVDALGGER
ncbi:MAG: IS66 family insertion sequence element accessory protein TnpA [Solirubrobacterales bacterium]